MVRNGLSQAHRVITVRVFRTLFTSTASSGIASYFNDNAKGWVSLLDATIGTDAAKKQALTSVPVQPWEEGARFAYQNKLAEDYKKISERREQVEEQASSTMLAQLRKTCLCKLDDLRSEAKSNDIADNWRINGQVHFSHLCRKEGNEKCIGRLVDWQEGLSDIEERNMQLSKLLIEHNGSRLR